MDSNRFVCCLSSATGSTAGRLDFSEPKVPENLLMTFISCHMIPSRRRKSFSASHESLESRSEVFGGGYIDTALLSRVISIQCPIIDNEALFCLYFSYSRYEPEISGRKA